MMILYHTLGSLEMCKTLDNTALMMAPNEAWMELVAVATKDNGLLGVACHTLYKTTCPGVKKTHLLHPGVTWVLPIHDSTKKYAS